MDFRRIFFKISNYTLKWIAMFLLTSSLYAGVKEDSEKVQQIKDLQSCVSTFSNILQKKIWETEQDIIDRAETAVNAFNSSAEFWQRNARNFEYVSWDLYPKFVKAYSLLYGLDTKPNKQFDQFGFAQGVIQKTLIKNFLKEMRLAKNITLLKEDHDSNYAFFEMDLITEELLNQNHLYYMLEDNQKEALKPIVASLEDPISECLGTPWRLVSVRVFEKLPNATEDGSNTWHKDEMPRSALKILIYPHGVSSDKGTIELQLAKGNQIIKGDPGTWILFKNSELVHREKVPKQSDRIVIELTIVPSLVSDLTPICAGLNARYPLLPWKYPQSLRRTSAEHIFGLNLARGQDWRGPPGWLILDALSEASHADYFYFYPNCRFPVEGNCLQTVYSSHALECFNQPTVYRILSESARVLEKDGNLILKIPDYDKVLDCWTREFASFFRAHWAFEGIVHLWGEKGVCDCLQHRAAMIFCSFLQNRYYGPPSIASDELRSLIQNRTPSQIAKELRKIVAATEENFTFVNQNAWNRKELRNLLNEFGFEIISFDPDVVIGSFPDIPRIDDMKEISMFCWAVKK